MNVQGIPVRVAPGNNSFKDVDLQFDRLPIAGRCGCGSKLPTADLRVILAALSLARNLRLIVGRKIRARADIFGRRCKSLFDRTAFDIRRTDIPVCPVSWQR